MKNIWKIFRIMVVVMLLLVPATASAAYSESVNVLGVNVNTGGVTYWKVIKESKWNTNTLAAGTADDYNVKYDRENQTLTLKNVNAPNASASGNYHFISFGQLTGSSKATVKIVLEGTNTIAKPGYEVNNGITGGQGISIEVGGSGSLTISNVLYGIAANGDNGGSVTINGGNITINSKNTAVRSYSGNVYIHGGTVNANISNSNSDVTAVYAGGANPALISIKDCVLNIDVKASSGVNLFRAWNAGGNRQIVIENAEVLARTNTSYGHRGVFSAQPTITGGTAYIGYEYDGSDAAAWDKEKNIGYDIVSFNGGGKGYRYLRIAVPSYTVTVSANPEAGGEVTGGGVYKNGETATVKAAVNEGWKFVNWTENGETVSTEAEYSFEVTGNRTLVANFVQKYTVAVSANPEAGGAVTGGGVYKNGQTATVNATANDGWEFVNWTENGETVSTEAEYSFEVTGNRTLIANFRALCTVVYTDGVDGKTVFEDRVFTGLSVGSATPVFGANPVREGYVFKGWSPEVAATVSGDAVYTAVWDIVPTTPVPPNDLPTTGDSSRMGMWLALMMLSMAGALCFGLRTAGKKN